LSLRKKFNNVLSVLFFLTLLFFLFQPFGGKNEKAEVKEKAKEEKKTKQTLFYDFTTPKEGRVLDLSSNRIDSVVSDKIAKKYKYGYSSRTPNKDIFAVTEPSTKNKLYFVNAYLNGFTPYQVSSVWLPLEYLRTRLKYQLDEKGYKGRLEVWQTSKESFIKLRGDCEDHAIVLADWLIGLGYDARIVIGEVKFPGQKRGGHAWVVLFKDSKEYILESTAKRKWNILPLASMLPYYYPRLMFNRKFLWYNKGSIYTTVYSGERWKKSGKFLPENSYYPDLQKHTLHIETKPLGAKIRILNIKAKFHQGIALKTGKYHLELSKKAYVKKRLWIDVNDKNVKLTIALQKHLNE